MKVFYTPAQNIPGVASFSPSAGKPAKVVGDWIKHGLIHEDDVLDFEPLETADFYLAHHPAFVKGILDGSIENGFGNHSIHVAESLPFTSGSLCAAAKHAIEHKTHTCSPTSGFHHAGYDFARGYCTLNGLVVAATLMQKNGIAEKIGILDCDAHFGDGTTDIIQRKKLGYIMHHTQGANFHDRSSVGRDANRFFNWLADSLYDLRSCDVILYQAGADPHINDPLGGQLTTEEMRKRDQMVFEALINQPLAWNLAGGYQTGVDGSITPVLDLHRNTAIECIKAQGERT